MNDAIANFHFLRPAGLLLTLVAVLVWWFLQRQTDPLKGWRHQIDSHLLDALVVGKDSVRGGKALGLLVVWIVTSVAIAGPTWRPAPSPFADDATPLMILLKTDVSMNAREPAPSRLERAQLKIADLAAAREGQPLGLIAYAGSAHLVLPATRDTDVVAEMANEISPEIMPTPGDRLDLALLEAGRVLAESQVRGNVLVIADSIDTESSSLSEAASEVNLPVEILAISSPGSSEASALQKAAKAMDAGVQYLSVDDSDVEAIVRWASRAPVMRSGESEGYWMETGYYLVPFVVAILLWRFRQDASAGEVTA